jgi:hypothetical protein
MLYAVAAPNAPRDPDPVRGCDSGWEQWHRCPSSEERERGSTRHGGGCATTSTLLTTGADHGPVVVSRPSSSSMSSPPVTSASTLARRCPLRLPPPQHCRRRRPHEYLLHHLRRDSDPARPLPPVVLLDLKISGSPSLFRSRSLSLPVLMPIEIWDYLHAPFQAIASASA